MIATIVRFTCRAVLAVVAGTSLAHAAPMWTLHTLVEPPVLPDLSPTDMLGFGASVSIGNVTWLAVGAPKADCTMQPQGTVFTDAGRVFLYKRVNGAWQYRQSICSEWPQQNAAFGQSLEISQGWLMIGAPYTQVGNQTNAGQVSFYRYDAATDTWKWHAWFNGLSTAPGGLGIDVALSRNIAIAGEPYYNGGRVRTWTLTSTTVTYDGAYAPGVFPAGYDYGRHVDVSATGCTMNACAGTPDTIAASSDDRVWTALRSTTGWAHAQSFSPLAGTSMQMVADVSVSARVLAIPAFNSSNRGTGCARDTRMVRLVQRPEGAQWFSSSNNLYACAPADALGTFGKTVTIDGGNGNVIVAAPDQFASSVTQDGGAVYTFAGTIAPQQLDAEHELGLAPDPGGLASYDDAFGASLAIGSSYLAVGAPWNRVFAPAYGRGYVAIYQLCC